MRNISSYQKKTCLFFRNDEFEKLIHLLFDEDVEVEFCFEDSGVNVYSDYCGIDDDTIIAKLSEHFGVNVSSFHTDGYYDCGVWVVYKES